MPACLDRRSDEDGQEDRSTRARLSHAFRLGVVVTLVCLALACALAPGSLQEHDPNEPMRAIIRFHQLTLEAMRADGEELPRTMKEVAERSARMVVERPSVHMELLPRHGFLEHGEWTHDRWRREFIYETEGSAFVLRSLGGDGTVGGWGRNRDISSEDGWGPGPCFSWGLYCDAVLIRSLVWSLFSGVFCVLLALDQGVGASGSSDRRRATVVVCASVCWGMVLALCCGQFR